MKTSLFILLLFSISLSMTAQEKRPAARSKQSKPASKDSVVIRNNERWEVVSDGVWRGKDSTRYKVKNEKIMEVVGGNSWAELKEGTWKDYDGNMIKLDGRVVMQSNDQGKTWKKAPDNCFKGGDKRTYMLDTNSMVLLRKCL